MNIWTESLEKAHMPILERWIGREEGALTPNDLPKNSDELPQWFERCTSDPGRNDFLILAYETPVGLAGLQNVSGQERTAELYLLLCEVNYNLLRTATYAALPMLDRAFRDCGSDRVIIRLREQHAWIVEVLERMGFFCVREGNGLIMLAVEREEFLQRKYLF